MKKGWRPLLMVFCLLLLTADSQPTRQQQQWFASFANDPAAQHQTALTFWQQGQKSDALYWWQRAAQRGSQGALQSLTKHFPQQRRKWLVLAAEQGEPAAVRALAARQLRQPGISWSKWQARWLQPRYEFLQEYEHLRNRSADCQQQVTVVAGSNRQKARYVQLLRDVQAIELPTAQWCFEWQLDASLQCTVDDVSQRAQCATSTPQVAEQRYIVFAAAGKSSAHGNRLTLSEHSDGAVLAHELAHWLGFADEYPMSKPLAEHFCQGRYDFRPLNLVTTTARTLTTAELKRLWQTLPWRSAVADWRQLAQRGADGRWQLGSDSEVIGLHPAATCDAVDGVYAWKPLAQQTPMERHQLQQWPALYQRLATQALMAN